MAVAVQGHPQQAAVPPRMPGPAQIPNLPVVQIIVPPVAHFNANQVNSYLKDNPDKTASTERLYSIMYKVAVAVSVVGYFGMIGVAILMAQAGLVLAYALGIAGAITSVYLGLKAYEKATLHGRVADQFKLVAKHYFELNDLAKRDALLQRIAHPQLHPQLRAPDNLPYLQRGLAHIAYLQERRGQLVEKQGHLQLEINQLQVQPERPDGKILQKRVSILILDDGIRLSKIIEAWQLLALANPATKSLDELVTFRSDISSLRDTGRRKWDWMIDLRVNQQFNDVQRTAFLTLRNRDTVSATAIDHATPMQLAAMLAGA